MTRVLIVEDALASAAYFKASLELEDYEVQHRASNFAGLLDPHDPDWIGIDVLLCDLMLPDVTGDQIIATARQHHPHVRCILFTAAGTRQAVAAGHQAQVVLLKPATHDELIRAIRGDDGRYILPIRR